MADDCLRKAECFGRQIANICPLLNSSSHILSHTLQTRGESIGQSLECASPRFLPGNLGKPNPNLLA